jgi:hypothetical protein
VRAISAMLFLVVLLWPGSFLAQSPYASIGGIVFDPDSKTISGAEIIVVNDGTRVQYETKTNNDGIYAVPNLPPGPYRVQVSKVGFKTIIKPDIILNVQDALSVNFTLPVGAASIVVTVPGGAPTINTQDASVSTVVDRELAENMPLNGRSFQTLIALTPGVVLTAATTSEQGQFSVNGQRADANYFSVDGVSANAGVGGSYGHGLAQGAAGSLPGLSALGGTNSLVSVDAMQEFRIQTSSFAPEYGRTPGGQVSIVTRSGTNSFHGTLFDYFRNDVLDANDWFANRHGLTKPKERQNDFGGVVGGPLVKDRAFFFFSYEGLRLQQPVTQETVVPDVASRQQAPTPIQPFLNGFPVPNGPEIGGGLAQFNGSYSNPSTLDAYSFRVDQTINSRFTLFGRWSYAPSQTIQRGPNVDGVAVLSNVMQTAFASQTLTVGLTAIASAAISNDLRANYTNVRASTENAQDNFGGAVAPPFTSLLPPGLSSGSFGFLVFGVGELSTGKVVANEQRQFNVVDNWSVARSSHQLKFGVDYRWLAPFSSPEYYQQLPIFSGMAGPGGVLSGVPLETNVYGSRESALLSQNVSLYGQDIWKASERLSLTYGLRWDVNPPLRSKNSSTSLYTIVGLNDPATMTLAPAGTPLYRTAYGNVAPRFGAVYQATRKLNWETVIRGGLGAFYDLGSGFLGYATAGYPFFAVNSVQNSPYPLDATEAVAPSGSTPKNGMYVAIPDLKTPRTYQWNVAVQQALGASQSVSATYVGALGRDLLRQDSLESPNASFGYVGITGNTATSDYHALQVKFQRRLSKGLQALVSYSFSHSIDIASTDSGAFNTPSSINSPNIDRGDSDFDVRHLFTGAAVYDVPSPRSRTAHAILGHWSLDSLIFVRSATPVNILGQYVFVGGRSFQARPDVLPGVPLVLYGPQYPGGKAFNDTVNPNHPGCSGPFCPANADQQGNLGRNVLRGFGAWQADVAVHRQFQLNARAGLQIRAECFNLLNHPNFGNPDSTIGDPLFGQSTRMLAPSLGAGGSAGGFNPLYQTGGPRSLQLALKLSF